MIFKSGDKVIKKTGGNIMKVIESTEFGICCGWISDSFYESVFSEDELVSIEDYKMIVKSIKRDHLISDILGEN